VVDLTYSLDYVARTSDEEAVRAHFDARTTAWLRVVAIIGVVVAFPHVLAGSFPRPQILRFLPGLTSFLISLLLLVAVRKSATHALAQLVRRRIRAVAIGFAIAQTALLATYHSHDEGVMAMPMIMAMLAIGFRLLPAEHVLLHATMAAIPSLLILSGNVPTDEPSDMVFPVVIANGMFLMLALLISRRARRNIISDWTHRRTNAREQLRMRDELRYARELQLSMLPECAPHLPWADICSVSVPATEVGGDYYDYFVEDGRVALVCGDVAGHGMAAGLVLSALRSGFTLLRDSLHDPAAVLRRLHDLVALTSRRRMLVTASVVLIDRNALRATVASAGHPPVLLRRAGGNVETINLFAPPLGVRLPVDIPQRTIDLAPGDTFILHSDGVYETRSALGEDYGMERLEEVVRVRGGGSAEELRDAIVRDVTAFRGSPDPVDDVTVVVCRVV